LYYCVQRRFLRTPEAIATKAGEQQSKRPCCGAHDHTSLLRNQ